jgi:hypothetical protein
LGLPQEKGELVDGGLAGVGDVNGVLPLLVAVAADVVGPTPFSGAAPPFSAALWNNLSASEETFLRRIWARRQES